MAVIVVGSINLDLTARIDHIPAPGETRLAKDLWVTPGGKGANQALAAKRMGATTRLIGTVGRDAFQRQALDLLVREGVDLRGVDARDGLTTGLALITVDAGGQNAITVAPGANEATEQVALGHLEAVVEAGDWVLLQNEIPPATVERALLLAREHGARVIWDPAPAIEHPPASLLTADILVPNQHEAEILLGEPVDAVRTAKSAARQLRARGAGVGIVKLGALGVVWATEHGVFYLPAAPVEAVDTVGAGDAFAGALAARLDRGDGFAEAIRIANAAAALSTTKRGAQASFPGWEAVRAFQQRLE